MRQAYKVWAGIAAAVFCLVAVVDLSHGSSAASTAASSTTVPTYVSTTTPTTSSPTYPAPSAPVSAYSSPTYSAPTSTADEVPRYVPDPYTGYASTPTYSADAGSGPSDSGSGSSGSDSGGAAYYPNCSAARAAGVAPLHRGDAGYSSKLDRDGDGVACE